MFKKDVKNVVLSLDSPYEISIKNAVKGKYIFKIEHNDEEIFTNLRNLFITFSSEKHSPEEISKILNIKSISEKHGVFKYIGEGINNSKNYIKEISFELNENIEHLEIKIKTFIKQKSILIKTLNIYDEISFFSDSVKVFISTNNIEKFIFCNFELTEKMLEHFESLKNTLVIFNKNSTSPVLNKSQNKHILTPENFHYHGTLSEQQIIILENYISHNVPSVQISSLLYEDLLFKKDEVYLDEARYLPLENYVKKIDVTGKKSVTIQCSVVNKKNVIIDNSALFSIKYLTDNGDLLLPSSEFAVNPNLGTYKYITSGSLESPGVNEIKIEIPNNSNIDMIELKFQLWGKDKLDSYIDTSSLNIIYEDQIVNANDEAPKNGDVYDKIILIYTTAPYIGHETLELRPNRLTKEYIKLGYKVIFFAFSKVPEEHECPSEYNGQLIQCHKDELHKYISLISKQNFKKKIFICSSFPDIYALTGITKLKLFNDWKIIYEIRDDMEEFNRVGYSTWYTTQLEVNVARLSDKIITVSPRLAQKIQVASNRSKDNSWKSKVQVIQNAAPDTLIAKSEYLRTRDVSVMKEKSNRVGYIGHLTTAWFDWNLLLNAAKDFPNIEFEIIGHGMPDTLELPKNIKYLGPKNHDEFLKISEKWKIGLIPFISSPLTYGVDPNKIYEYLAVNLLVVTADMGSVKSCPATFVYETYSEFKDRFSEALATKYTQQLRYDIINYVNTARWSNRAKQMIFSIQEEV